MSSYQIVFSDLDGTLLNSAHHVPPGTVQILNRLQARGIAFVIVTARMPAAAYPLQRETGTHGPLVCYGGALTLDENRRPMRSVRLSAEDSRAVTEFANTLLPGVVCSLYENDVWYVQDPSNELVKEESRITGVIPRPFPSAAEERIRPHKIFYMIPDRQQCARLLAALRAEFAHLAVSHSGFGHIEVTAKEAVKSEGMKSVCDALAIPLHNAVAFGDSLNDIDMLRSAGLGVAVDNAPQEVKKAADSVCPSNDEEGVGRFLENLFVKTLSPAKKPG